MSQDLKKCITVHLPIDLFEKINEYKAKTALSQSGIIIDLLEKGLGKIQNANIEVKKYFFVKVRIDPSKMLEFGGKLQNGEIDTSLIIMTYCIKEDPTVGISFWKAENQKNFEEVFSQHTPYYKEILEIIPVISPTESMNAILENMNSEK
jgi:hypothetical protein